MSHTSLVVQQIRIGLPIQGTQVYSPVQEGSMYRGATKPCTTTAEAVCCSYRSPHALEPIPCHKGSHSNEKPAHRKEE